MSTVAKIYKPAKNPMQSGRANTRVWKLEYVKPAPATPEALMGWNTMPDTITEVKLVFPTKEEAIAYATAKNIAFEVIENRVPGVGPKAYAENFSNGKRRAWDSNC